MRPQSVELSEMTLADDCTPYTEHRNSAVRVFLFRCDLGKLSNSIPLVCWVLLTQKLTRCSPSRALHSPTPQHRPSRSGCSGGAYYASYIRLRHPIRISGNYPFGRQKPTAMLDALLTLLLHGRLFEHSHWQ